MVSPTCSEAPLAPTADLSACYDALAEHYQLLFRDWRAGAIAVDGGFRGLIS